MIEFVDVSKWYGAFQVLKKCTTRVDKGEVVVVLMRLLERRLRVPGFIGSAVQTPQAGH